MSNFYTLIQSTHKDTKISNILQIKQLLKNKFYHILDVKHCYSNNKTLFLSSITIDLNIITHNIYLQQYQQISLNVFKISSNFQLTTTYNQLIVHQTLESHSTHQPTKHSMRCPFSLPNSNPLHRITIPSSTLSPGKSEQAKRSGIST